MNVKKRFELLTLTSRLFIKEFRTSPHITSARRFGERCMLPTESGRILGSLSLKCIFINKNAYFVISFDLN